MKIIVHYTWHRGIYNKDTVSRPVILTVESKSKKAVTEAIRDWVKEWTGKGHVLVSSIQPSFGDDDSFCQIAQKKFNFNN